MSWQNYVDQQLMGSGLVAKAVIAGHDGTLWAKSNNIEVSKKKKRISAFCRLGVLVSHFDRGTKWPYLALFLSVTCLQLGMARVPLFPLVVVAGGRARIRVKVFPADPNIMGVL